MVTAVREPPPLVMVQVTPWFSVASPATVAVMASVPAPAMAVGVVGIVTEIGVSVTTAVPVLVVSVLLVAVMVAEVVVTGDGAVYTPAEVMAPIEAVQVTPALAESFETVAVNVCVAPATNVAVEGVTATLIDGGAGVLPPQPMIEVSTARLAKASASLRKVFIVASEILK